MLLLLLLLPPPVPWFPKIMKNKNTTITLQQNYFEHLLNCLANQKFIRDINADGLNCDYKKIQKKNQKIIDKAYNDGRKMLQENY